MRLCLCESSGTGGTWGDFLYFYMKCGVGEPGPGSQRDFGPNGDFPTWKVKAAPVERSSTAPTVGPSASAAQESAPGRIWALSLQIPFPCHQWARTFSFSFQ